MVEDWQSIIAQLEAQQKNLQPGNPDKLDIALTIQLIQADVLDGNTGHAQYFLTNPEAKELALGDIRTRIARQLPPEVK
jgi:hypothetical protein